MTENKQIIIDDQLSSRYSELVSESNQLKTEKTKAEQKLERIREIADYTYDRADKENDVCFYILQIIDNVE